MANSPQLKEMKTKKENKGIFEVQPKHGTILNMAEHQHSEWKEVWKDEYLKWISGFANAEGGVLVIGRNDKGIIVGVSNAKKLMEDLPNKIKNMLGVLPEVNLKEFEGKEYIKIHVEPSTSPITYKGKLYIRRGSTNQLLDGPALQDFILKKSNIEWDEVIVNGATIEDVDLEAIETFKREAKKSVRIKSISDATSVEDVLKNLNLMNNEDRLTRAGVILFCKNPERFILPANVKIGRFGDSDTDLRSQELVEGNHFEIADKIIQLLDYKYFIRNISYDGLKRIETPEYPFEAIREAIFNAIIHRKYDSTSIFISVYDDRLEIWNEGLLHESLTIEDLKRRHRSHPRNRLMANVLFKAGFIETWGRGTIKILEECKKYGLPEPQIHEYSGGVAVTLYKNKTAPDFLATLDLNDRQLKAIEYVKNNTSITRAEYQREMETSERTASRDIDELVKLEIFLKKGNNKSTNYILK